MYLNTATFEYPLAQLTPTDSILSSDLFQHLADGINSAALMKAINELKVLYKENVKSSAREVKSIIGSMPQQWHIPSDVVASKLNQLFDPSWVTSVWDNFMECLNDSLRNG